MKVVIAGAGEVGTHLARMLSYEELDITLMDENDKKLYNASRKMEIMPVTGNPTRLTDLENANVDKADLFISVLPDETANILSCHLAKMLGAKQTIARINNHEYLNPTNSLMLENLNIDAMIYPEELAANEIVSTIKHPWTRQYVELFNGAFAMVAVKVRDGAFIIGKRLYELNQDNKTYHVVAIKRDTTTIIPSGSTIIEHNDLVFFTVLTEYIDDVRVLCGKKNVEVDKIVIMGANPIALRTIDKLPNDINICLIDENKEYCMKLTETMPDNVSIYHGDGRDPDLIEDIGLHNTQVFMALTGNSETNILACFAAKRYDVFKTIAKEENIDYIALAYRLDIGTLINKKLLAAGHIYKMLWGQRLGSVSCLPLVSNAEVAELIIGRNSNLVGKAMCNVNLGGNITLGGLIRNGVAMMVSGDTVFEHSDHVVVFYHNMKISKLKELFN